MYTIHALNSEDATEMLGWRYADDYAMYNILISADELSTEIASVLDPANHFYGIYHDETFIGHCVFYAEAQVMGGDYTEEAIDIGVGMRPDWTGKGKGTRIIQAVLDFAQKNYPSETYRATIAAWNIRAQKATQRAGFQKVAKFTHPKTGMKFVILRKSV